MREIDITALLFPAEELSPEQRVIEGKRIELYDLASQEASRLQADAPFSPILLLNETNRLYREYLQKAGIPYDEERGM